MRNLLLSCLTLACLTVPAPAFAHQIWLEPAPGGAKLFFGEFGENLREVSPGLLDKIPGPTATLVKGQSLIVEETTYPVMERKSGDQVTRMAWTPAARLAGDWSAQKPALTLDITPTGTSSADSVELLVTYKGQPLPKAKVGLVAASGWAQEKRTDETGKLTVSLPWKGTYVVELHHDDPAPGNRAGQPFEKTSYVTTLTLLRADGLIGAPASPPAKPN